MGMTGIGMGIADKLLYRRDYMPKKSLDTDGGTVSRLHRCRDISRLFIHK